MGCLARRWGPDPPARHRRRDLLDRPPDAGPRGPSLARPSWLAWTGTMALDAHARAIEMLAFLGGILQAAYALLRGRARFRRSDLAIHVQDCGASALPIVTLISFLVGVIMAFVGTVQLR